MRRLPSYLMLALLLQSCLLPVARASSSDGLRLTVEGVLMSFDPKVARIKTDEGTVVVPRDSVDVVGKVTGKARVVARVPALVLIRLNSSK